MLQMWEEYVEPTLMLKLAAQYITKEIKTISVAYKNVTPQNVHSIQNVHQAKATVSHSGYCLAIVAIDTRVKNFHLEVNE